MIDLDWTWPELHDAFFLEDKYVCIRTARRSFKTLGGTRWMIEELLEEQRSGLWVDTTHPNIEKYLSRNFQPLLKDYWSKFKWNQQKKILTFPNGSYIDFGSAQRSELLEGFEYDRVFINEAGIVLKKSGIWENTLFPMTKKDTCKVRLVGTPKSKNMFHALSKRYTDIHYTIYDSPYYTEEQRKQIKKSLSAEAFRQEYLAEFLEGAGVVFRNIQQCIKEPLDNINNNVMAVDLAKHQDFTVIMCGNNESKQVGYIERFNQIDWNFQKKRILNAWLQHGRPKCIIDSTGVGDAIYDDLVANGMQVESFKFTNKSKNEIIQNLSVSMDNQDIFIPGDQELIGELELFAYEMTSSGNIRYNAPDGFHDDMVVALAMLNKLMNEHEELRFALL